MLFQYCEMAVNNLKSEIIVELVLSFYNKHKVSWKFDYFEMHSPSMMETNPVVVTLKKHKKTPFSPQNSIN